MRQIWRHDVNLPLDGRQISSPSRLQRHGGRPHALPRHSARRPMHGSRGRFGRFLQGHRNQADTDHPSRRVDVHREGEAQVSVSKEGPGFKTVCSIHLPSGATMEGQGVAADAYTASNEALDHVEKRLRRYKRRLKDHSKKAKAKKVAKKEEAPAKEEVVKEEE